MLPVVLTEKCCISILAKTNVEQQKKELLKTRTVYKSRTEKKGKIATEDNYLIRQQHIIQTAERLRTYTTSPRKEYLSENITVAWEKNLYFKLFRES